MTSHFCYIINSNPVSSTGQTYQKSVTQKISGYMELKIPLRKLSKNYRFYLTITSNKIRFPSTALLLKTKIQSQLHALPSRWKIRCILTKCSGLIGEEGHCEHIICQSLILPHNQCLPLDCFMTTVTQGNNWCVI